MQVEFVLQLRVGFDVDAAAQQKIDGTIEIGLRVNEVPLAVRALPWNTPARTCWHEHFFALLLGRRLASGQRGSAPPGRVRPPDAVACGCTAGSRFRAAEGCSDHGRNGRVQIKER